MSEDYQVGYKKPPKHSRFKKGLSGNPCGRPKGAKNLKTILEAELSETIVVREGDRQKKISKLEGVVKALLAKALKGDPRGMDLVLRLAAQHILADQDDGEDGALSETDQALLEQYIAREKPKSEGS